MIYDKEVSILLPSLREKLVSERIYQWAKTNPDVNYEIILVSPFQISDGKVNWINEGGQQRGSVHATNVAASVCQGEYMIYMSDDVQPTKDCLRNMLNFMKEEHLHPFLGAFKMLKSGNKEIGPFGAYDKLYACYGCISKADLLLVSNILFKPAFKYSWGDIDLSLRVWEKGGEVKICNTACVIPEQIEDELYQKHRKETFQQDIDTFLGFWHKKLGGDMERNHEKVNKRLKKDS